MEIIVREALSLLGNCLPEDVRVRATARRPRARADGARARDQVAGDELPWNRQRKGWALARYATDRQAADVLLAARRYLIGGQVGGAGRGRARVAQTSKIASRVRIFSWSCGAT